MNTNSPQTAIFLHIPKTAGTTLYGLLWRHYEEGELYTIDGTFNTHNDFQHLNRESKAQIRLLSGHLNYGIHEQLPQPATYFTILREPIDLVISYYYFVRGEPMHPLHGLVSSGGMSFADFLNGRIDESMSNMQTRLLAGKAHSGTYYDCLPADLEMAKHNLRTAFSVVGLTNEFDTTLLLLQKAFGWKKLYYARMNVTRKRPAQDELSADVRVAIEKANQLDIELYQYAAALFQAQVRRQGDTFPAEVRAFQRRNRRRYSLYYLAWHWRRQSRKAYRLLRRRLSGNVPA